MRKLKQMDPYALNLFLHLSESLHFGRTSRACNISPSGLSRAIQRLEQDIGKKLFERDRRNVRLTESGRLFRDYALETVERWRELRQILQEQEEMLAGEISIFCSVTASYSLLSDILGVFRGKYPLIHIRLLTGDEADSIREVQDEKADISIAARPDKLPQGLDFNGLLTTPLVFIIPTRDYGLKIPARDDEWARIPLVLPERNLARTRVDRWFRRKGLMPNIYAQVEGNEAIVAFVSLGCGIGVVPKLVLENSSLRSKVRILNDSPELPPYQVGLCCQKKRLGSPLVSAFWGLFQGESNGYGTARQRS